MPSIFRFVFFLGDLIFLNVSIILSYYLLDLPVFDGELTNSIYLFIFSNLTSFFLALVSNPYEYSRNSGIIKLLKVQTSFLFVHLLVVASLIFLFNKVYAPWQIVIMYMLFVSSFSLSKLFILYVISIFDKQRTVFKNLIIIGKDNQAKETRKYIQVHPELGYRFLGMFAKSDEMTLDHILTFCIERDVHEIYCQVSELNNNEVKKIIDFGLNRLIRIKLLTAEEPGNHQPLTLDRYSMIPVSSIGTVPLDDLKNKLLKRIFDFTFSLAVSILILSWLVPIISLAIVIDSRGPVFFGQRRAGKGNRPFRCLKFRTMVVNNEADSKQATKFDLRITRLGRILRKSSLDEIPQFFNVLLGDMSVIGPRPHPIKLNEQFAPMIEILMSRHYVRPGITGLAQSMGYRGETKDITDMENRVKLDRFYIENWSFLLDIKIIVQTIASLIRGNENAY